MNGGFATACNRGIGTATGEVMALLDSDDLFEPTCLEEMMARFAAASGLFFVACTTTMFGVPNRGGATTQGRLKRSICRLEGARSTMTTWKGRAILARGDPQALAQLAVDVISDEIRADVRAADFAPKTAEKCPKTGPHTGGMARNKMSFRRNFAKNGVASFGSSP